MQMQLKPANDHPFQY